ncbi:NAD(P)/FAD-dependent oxidoreductase [Cellulomonas sp. KRMCY2]|uniref:protoporphyrinogen/coproporphyrinogen oxidase n=1 Tax=Cellulomonas sp. KRMCY2 TaxID=1304865 RepID=UPI00045E8FBA|nr:FAD-dependent oxidoreductase [Cellulomonas sp. KRMCY2]
MTGDRQDQRYDVVVVGGGVAGLVTARDLALGGLDVLVLEAADRLGGCVSAQQVAGLRVDAGAESFATRSPAVTDLITELGLAGDVVVPAAGSAWVQMPGSAHPLPSAGMLGIPVSPWAPDVRRSIGLLGALRATADRLLPARFGLGPVRGGAGPAVAAAPAVSLGRLVRVRLGHRVLDRLVAPVVVGVHSAHPDDLDLDALLPTVRGLIAEHGSLGVAVSRLRAASPAGSAVASLIGGMNRLVTALAEDATRLRVEIRTDTRVDAIAADSGGWQVRTADGTLVAGAVVLAVPGPVAATLLADLVPQAAPLDALATTGVVLATLVVDAPALDGAPRGTGVLVTDGVPGVRAKALTHATAKWAWLAEAAGPGRHVLRLSYGRADVLPKGAPANLGAVALADAAALLGVPLVAEQVVDFTRTSWLGGVPHARPGHRALVGAVRTALAGRPGLHACGAWLAGTGLVAVVEDARSTAAQILATTAPHAGQSGGRAPS